MGFNLMLLVANLNNSKVCKKNRKMTETLAHGYSSQSTEFVVCSLSFALSYD